MFYSPLKNTIYRAVWIATFFSNIGTWVHTVTSSLLMTKLTTSSTLIALVQTVSMLPLFMFSIPAGVIADIIDRRSLIIIAQLSMSLFAFTMAYLSHTGLMSASYLLMLTLFLNIGLAFNQPAWQALSSTLVESGDIKQAAALNNLSFNLSRCIGPALAGLYFSKFGPTILYMLNGFSFLGVIFVLYDKVPAAARSTNKLSCKQIIHGFKASPGFFNDYPALKFIVSKSFTYFTLASSLWSLLPYIVIIQYHMTDYDLGILTGAAGIGAVLNAYFIYKLRNFLSDEQLTTLALLLAGFSILLVAKITSLNLLFVLMCLFGFSWSLSVSVYNGVLQSEFPKEIRSRLIGIYCVIFSLAQVIGSYVSGLAIHHIGLSATMLIVACLTLLVGVSHMLAMAIKIYIFQQYFLMRE